MSSPQSENSFVLESPVRPLSEAFDTLFVPKGVTTQEHWKKTIHLMNGTDRQLYCSCFRPAVALVEGWFVIPPNRVFKLTVMNDGPMQAFLYAQDAQGSFVWGDTKRFPIIPLELDPEGAPLHHFMIEDALNNRRLHDGSHHGFYHFVRGNSTSLLKNGQTEVIRIK